MKLPLNLNRSIARLLMALLLFTQGVLPASTYAAAPAVPAPAAAMEMPGHAGAGMPCHDSGTNAATGTCLAHCSQADQASLDHAHLAALPAALAIWQAAVPPLPRLPARLLAQAAPHPGASPPLPILYCSLLN